MSKSLVVIDQAKFLRAMPPTQILNKYFSIWLSAIRMLNDWFRWVKLVTSSRHLELWDPSWLVIIKSTDFRVISIWTKTQTIVYDPVVPPLSWNGDPWIWKRSRIGTTKLRIWHFSIGPWSTNLSALPETGVSLPSHEIFYIPAARARSEFTRRATWPKLLVRPYVSNFVQAPSWVW